MLLAVRLARWVTVALVAVVVVLGGGGYYYATQIASEALKLDPYVPRTTMTVLAVKGGTLTIEGSSADLRRRGTYGVFWAGGYGQVTGTPQGSGAVTRAFRLLTGRAPRAGDRVGITSDAFPDDPRIALGAAARSVTYRSPAGAFPAWYVPSRGSTWVVLVHGRGANRTEMLRMMRVPVRLGLPALDISYRNDAGAPLDESRHYRYGAAEWHDLDAAVLWAQEHGARRVVLVGASMGGAVVAAFLEHSARAAAVSGVVLDAPLLSLDRAVDLGARKRSLPLVGWSIPGPLTWTAKRFATIRYGVDWDAADFLDDTRWVRVPVLLVHGTADGTVPVSGSKDLAADLPARVTLVLDVGVTHVQSWNQDPARYEDRLTRFLVRAAAQG